MTEFPEPRGAGAPGELLARYLAFYRHTVLRKLRSLPADELRTSRMPSGWTPIELLSHLVHMERRWLVWGFLGEDVAEVWGEDLDGRWHVPDDVTLDDLADRLLALGVRTSRVLAVHALGEPAPPGPRFDDDPPTLGWICFHVLQEYARHTGHLDAAVELAGGELGE